MVAIALITDNEARSQVLTRNMNLDDRISIHNMDTEYRSSEMPEFLIVDVAYIDSSAIVRLRHLLNKIRGHGVGLLLLSHGNAARAEVQARIIDAVATMPASTLPQILRATVLEMCRPVAPAPVSSAVELAAEARRFLIEAFFSGETITLEVATAGSELVARAIAKTGVRDWVSAVQQFDNATHQHCLLVAGLSAAFANSMGFGSTQNFRLTKAALLHDVGKTRIPLSILNKPGALTPAEMAVMRTHPVKGFEMLQGRFSRETLQVVRSHHEMLDGSGYPDGLQSHQIPDLVRLVTICDIFGALLERRPYKPPMPAARAYSILVDMRGRLDQELVKAFEPVAATIA